MGGFWATGRLLSAKSDQFWVDIFKPKWNLSYIDGARLRDIGPLPRNLRVYGGKIRPDINWEAPEETA